MPIPTARCRRWAVVDRGARRAGARTHGRGVALASHARDRCLPRQLPGGRVPLDRLVAQVLPRGRRARRISTRASGTTMEWDTAAGHAVLLAAGGSRHRSRRASRFATASRVSERELRRAGPRVVPAGRARAPPTTLGSSPFPRSGAARSSPQSTCVASLSPLMGSFARYVVACAALLVAAFALGGGLPRLTRSQWIATFVLGALGVFAYNLFFMGALERLPGVARRAHHRAESRDHDRHLRIRVRRRLRPHRWVGVAGGADRRVDRRCRTASDEYRVGGGRTGRADHVVRGDVVGAVHRDRAQGAGRAVAAGGDELRGDLGNAACSGSSRRRSSPG